MTERSDCIVLAHGGGGLLSRELISCEIVSRFGGGPLKGLPDAATLPRPDGELLFTTDSFVVSPLEFPGGNIGTLAVCGTVNDLCVAGARPEWLSLALIIEEGLPLALLRRILDSIKAQAEACEVAIATGDTKVVPHGQADGIYINTAGIGTRIDAFRLSPDCIADGDIVLVSGPIGDHGMAVLASREGIRIEGPRSDCAPVHRLVNAAADFGSTVRFMRDPTRGGVAGVLHEVVEGRPFGIELDETALPTSPTTQAIAELLGMDLLNVACEGRVLALVDAAAADDILAAWRVLPEGAGAAMMGRVILDPGRVTLRTVTGGKRRVDCPRGELLPRIC